MRALLTLLMLRLMTTILLAGQSPIFITDPQQLTSQRRPDVQSFNLEKLYLTRLVGATAWSPDGKFIAFMSDYDGDEQWDLFLSSPLSGEVVNLTETKDISEENPV